VSQSPSDAASQPRLLAGSERIGEDQLFVRGVKPSPGHQVRGGSRADLLGEFGHPPMFLRGEDSLLNAQFAKSDLQDLKVGDLIHHGGGGAIVIVIVVIRCHAEGPFEESQ
jgi:hypothetical protein